MELVIKKYQELTSDELYEILKVRAEVFVVEQHCVYQDMDNLDQCAVHIYLRDDDGIQAYLRVIEPGKAGEDVVIGRVLSKKAALRLGNRNSLCRHRSGKVSDARVKDQNCGTDICEIFV